MTTGQLQESEPVMAALVKTEKLKIVLAFYELESCEVSLL